MVLLLTKIQKRSHEIKFLNVVKNRGILFLVSNYFERVFNYQQRIF